MNAQPHLIARVRPDLARTEQELSCHLFPLPPAGQVPESLRAYCGFDITPGRAERLDGPVGMPCMPCLLRAALTA